LSLPNRSPEAASLGAPYSTLFERELYVTGALRPSVKIGRQHRLHQRMEVEWKFGRKLLKRRGIRALPVTDLANELVVVRSLEGRHAHGELVEDGTEPINVRTLRRSLSSDHFGGEIGDRPRKLGSECQRSCRLTLDPRETEVR
jgi:hypothetical protein